MSEGPLLRPEEVAGVLSGMEVERVEAVSAETGRGPVPYSLREPIAIPPGTEAAAKKRIESLVSALQDSLRRELGDDLALEVDALQQLGVSAALSTVPPPAWVPSFSRADGGGIALVLAPGTGLALVERALGGPGVPSESGREPTGVELRVVARLAAAAAGPLGTACGTPLSAGDIGVGSVPAAIAAPGETVGVGLLRVRLGDAERSALLLVPASLLLPSRTAQEAAGKVRIGCLAPALERVRVEARPVLRAGRISFGDLLELAQGAVLRLDVPEGAALDLRIGGQALFRGRIVRTKDGCTFGVEWRRTRREPAARRVDS
ncbi:MAG: FliM/FliN family flagellar motor switch protein [Acidobacteriia bacterium]|nr:FliM/FliN family flagellar motor switch protein [Terriglobia bacterium]